MIFSSFLTGILNKRKGSERNGGKGRKDENEEEEEEDGGEDDGEDGDEEILEAEADFTRSMQIIACQKTFHAAHSVLVQDLQSCTAIKSKGNNTHAENSDEVRNARTLKWLQPKFDNNASRYVR